MFEIVGPVDLVPTLMGSVKHLVGTALQVGRVLCESQKLTDANQEPFRIFNKRFVVRLQRLSTRYALNSLKMFPDVCDSSGELVGSVFANDQGYAFSATKQQSPYRFLVF